MSGMSSVINSHIPLASGRVLTRLNSGSWPADFPENRRQGHGQVQTAQAGCARKEEGVHPNREAEATGRLSAVKIMEGWDLQDTLIP